MITGKVDGASFSRRITAALRRKLARRSPRSLAQRWRRADLLWPDFAPRYED